MGKHSSFVAGQWMFSDSECARRGLFFARAAQIELSFLRTFPYISVALQPSGRAREEARNVTARVHTCRDGGGHATTAYYIYPAAAAAAAPPTACARRYCIQPVGLDVQIFFPRALSPRAA